MNHDFPWIWRVLIIVLLAGSLLNGWPTTRWSVRGLRLAVIMEAAIIVALGCALFSGLVEHPGRELVMGLMLLGTGLLVGWYAGRPEPQRCRECGCTETTPCLDDDGYTCFWFLDDLCSSCAYAQEDAYDETILVETPDDVARRSLTREEILQSWRSVQIDDDTNDEDEV